MPGINEVAQLAGVSTATVSRALSGNGHVSEATRQRVHAAALELEYVVSSNASSLATGRTKNVDVVIAIALELTEAEVGRLHDMNKPIVGVGGTIEGVRTLSIDDPGVARLATEHLLSLGHSSIAHIGGNSDSEMDFHVPTRRRGGYEGALIDAGI